MQLLARDVIKHLEYKIRQAEHYKTYHFCEVCKMFSPRRPCKYKHQQRYWALHHFRSLHQKLQSEQSLSVEELLLLEVIAP